MMTRFKYFISRKNLTDSDLIRLHGFTMNAANQMYFSSCHPLQPVIYMKLKLNITTLLKIIFVKTMSKI